MNTYCINVILHDPWPWLINVLVAIIHVYKFISTLSTCKTCNMRSNRSTYTKSLMQGTGCKDLA